MCNRSAFANIGSRPVNSYRSVVPTASSSERRIRLLVHPSNWTTAKSGNGIANPQRRCESDSATALQTSLEIGLFDIGQSNDWTSSGQIATARML